MTRKDYILIEAALLRTWNAQKIHDNDEAQRAQELMFKACASDLCDALSRDNPRFDRERFLREAGVQS